MTEYEELWAYKFCDETKVEHEWCVSKEEESEEATKQYSRFYARQTSKERE